MDAVKLAVHEAEVDLRSDNERLRQTLAASRETAARADEEASRARLQSGRMAAALSERDRDLQGLADGMGARVERLAEELQAATVREQDDRGGRAAQVEGRQMVGSSSNHETRFILVNLAPVDGEEGRKE